MKNYHYQNFEISFDSLDIIIWSACIGIIIGAFIAIFYKHWTSSFIKVLTRNGIDSPEKACTVDSLRFSGKWYIKNELKLSYKALRRYVLCANEKELLGSDEGKKEKKLPMDKAKFYLPEEQRFTAELRYSEVRNPVGSFIITVAIAIGAAFFAKFAVPELMQMLDNFLTMM